MSKPKLPAGYQALGEMPVREAIELNLDMEVDIACRKIPAAEVKRLERETLGKWYRILCMSIITPLMNVGQLGKKDAEGEADASGVSEAGIIHHSYATATEQLRMIHLRQRLRDVFAETKQRLLEVEDMIQEIAQDRGIENMKSQLPDQAAQYYYDFIVNDEAEVN
jgi:hypothetical protein